MHFPLNSNKTCNILVSVYRYQHFQKDENIDIQSEYIQFFFKWQNCITPLILGLNLVIFHFFSLYCVLMLFRYLLLCVVFVLLLFVDCKSHFLFHILTLGCHHNNWPGTTDEN